MQLKVKVWGPLACFTRPELKTERVSYPVMTPAAARGVLEAIFWKPAIRWVVTRIHVLRPIRFVGFRRNEVNSKIPLTRVRGWMQGEVVEPYLADEDRAQRATLALQDVAYVIEAGFNMTDRRGPEEQPQKFAEIFARRVEKGQCFHRPYLGCREFTADFGMAASDEHAIAESRELGIVFHDFDYGPPVSPRFFQAALKRGVLHVPPFAKAVRS